MDISTTEIMSKKVRGNIVDFLTKKIHGNNEDFSTTELTSKKVRRNNVNGLRYIDVIWTSNQRGVPVGPMDTSLSICHRFDVEIPREKFFEISLISKGESTWKL